MALVEVTRKQIVEDKERAYQKRKKQMENMDIVRYTVRIPTHIHTKFKIKLSSQRKNMKAFFMDMIAKYLDEK